MSESAHGAARADVRYVLALGEDAKALLEREDVIVLRRLPNVALVEVDHLRALAIAQTGRFVHIYESEIDALRAFALFEPTSLKQYKPVTHYGRIICARDLGE